MKRIKIIIQGAVQGVGFRPFVYRLADEMKLNGWIINSSQGVFIEAESDKDILEKFIFRVRDERPPRSYIQSMEFSYLDPVGYKSFEIRKSKDEGDKTVLVLPDIAVCDDCLKEIFHPENRRYLYPFTNCTNCGPRFSIIEELPYDRHNTTMSEFEMCDECKEEYGNPKDRRFHAQPNACPKCGPHIELWDSNGDFTSDNNDALIDVIDLIKKGKIVAIKGIGGFHLMADAGNEESAKRLRKRKNREEKPFALMFPNLESIKNYCDVSELEKRLLQSPECPIGLLKKKNINNTFELSAPGNPYLGVMLPYAPLHHILMKGLGFPVIATSGNISDEPICTDENEAVKRLQGIADFFLVHNRPIVRHVDDSIARIISGREMIIRRARGYAPLPIKINTGKENIIAVGPHLKNTIALNIGKNVFISQHIGDLETAEAYRAFSTVINDLTQIYDTDPKIIVSDTHPDYESTRFAEKSGLDSYKVQHHYAHILSCMAENEIEGDVLGVSWDGSGLGTDGTIWGGEFLLIQGNDFKRIGHLRPFKLPGGEKAVKEIWRTEIGLLFEIFMDRTFEIFDAKFKLLCPAQELSILKRMLMKNINSPLTSSAGRLFDAVSSIMNISNYASYEGKAAMQLEFSIMNSKTGDSYPFEIKKEKISENDFKYIADWEPMIREIIKDVSKKKQTSGIIATKFHNTLSEIIVSIAKRVNNKRVVLSGGCFQNKYLIEKTITLLQRKGFQVYWHQRVPTNDGGISLGQIKYVSDLLNNQSKKV
jgi:hydrogenase maturation protein HypF